MLITKQTLRVWYLIRGVEVKRLSSELKVPGSNSGYPLSLADETQYGLIPSSDARNAPLNIPFVLNL